MTIDKAQLKALAEASLIGDWYEAGDLRYEDRKTGDIHGLHHDDDRLIAAANPTTILALLAEIERLTEEVALDDKIIAERDRLVDAIPQCAAHGQCIPYAIQWVKDAQTDLAVLRELGDNLKAENERFDEGMRSIASNLGAGGYNAESLSATELIGKVRWGVDHLCEASERRVAELKAENEALRKALGDLLALYEDDEGCRSLPEYIAGRAAMSKEAAHG